MAIIGTSVLRLRPTIMTTAATMLAALPLALATGAGAAGRRHIGLVVTGGLLVSTLLTLFVVPAVYSLLAQTAHNFPCKPPIGIKHSTE